MDKEHEHMERRHKEHGSIRKTAEEFGVSKSKLHRILQSHKEADKEKDAS